MSEVRTTYEYDFRAGVLLDQDAPLTDEQLAWLAAARPPEPAADWLTGGIATLTVPASLPGRLDDLATALGIGTMHSHDVVRALRDLAKEVRG